ncbi:MAG TPA: hypothetical protein VNO70_21465, partial [Blastocatellia bacterium]|nr:hypothetical protein [Blastocatellia bacterium]
MLNRRFAFIALLLFFLIGNSIIVVVQQPHASAQSGPTITDVPVSPADHPDPRNETAIAVSKVDDRILVGASKVIIGGGGPAARGTSNVAYYYSSDGGNTWGS